MQLILSAVLGAAWTLIIHALWNYPDTTRARAAVLGSSTVLIVVTGFVAETFIKESPLVIGFGIASFLFGILVVALVRRIVNLWLHKTIL